MFVQCRLRKVTGRELRSLEQCKNLKHLPRDIPTPVKLPKGGPAPTLSALDPLDAGAGFENLSFFSVMAPYLVVTLRTRKYIYVIVVEKLGRGICYVLQATK